MGLLLLLGILRFPFRLVGRLRRVSPKPVRSHQSCCCGLIVFRRGSRFGKQRDVAHGCRVVVDGVVRVVIAGHVEES